MSGKFKYWVKPYGRDQIEVQANFHLFMKFGLFHRPFRTDTRLARELSEGERKLIEALLEVEGVTQVFCQQYSLVITHGSLFDQLLIMEEARRLVREFVPTLPGVGEVIEIQDDASVEATNS